MAWSEPAGAPVLSRELGQPADEIQLVDGRRMLVAPLSVFPGAYPKFVDSLVCEPVDKSGTVVTIRAAELKAIVYFETQALQKLAPASPNPTHDQPEAAA